MGKTISGALHRIPNLEHNNRDHWPPNADHNREYRNRIMINGTTEITLEQTYAKLFEASYQEWRAKEIKKSRGDRCPPTYYEKIKQDKQKHLLYEIIWQIGDMEDTGYDSNIVDAECAEQILLEFAEHMLGEVPHVTYLTKERLEDPDWKPLFDEGIIIHNFVLNGDESTPHLHMSFIPYTTHCSRGQKMQNAFSQTFKDMGYKTTMQQAIDDADNLVWQDTPKGKVLQMKKTEYGAIGWIEEQKDWIAEKMYERCGWTWFFKGKNAKGDMLLSDFKREKAAERAKEIEEKVKEIQSTLDSQEIHIIANQEIINDIDNEFKEKKELLEDTDTALQKKQVEVYQKSQELTDKKKELSILQGNLEETVRKVEIAEEVYTSFSRSVSSERESDLFEEIVRLRYDNEQKDYEIKTLKQKLNEAYEFMKQFTLSGINMLEKFFETIRTQVREMKSGRNR